MLKAEGVITSVPEFTKNKSHFNFLISKINERTVFPFTTRLTWSYPPQDLYVGQTWRIQIRLHNIHSPANPGSFNYEHWAKAHHILANGFVLPSADYELIDHHHPIQFLLMYLRECISKKITTFTHSDYSPFLTALSVGLREGITQKQWDILQATGTNHLIAVAGLHIGFLTSFSMIITFFLWRRSKKLLLLFPAPLAAACTALIAASCYSALAGFALPTLRALIMLSVLLVGTLCRRHLTLATSFSLSMIIMLILNPFIIYEDSFWLSFGSVGLILYSTQGKLRSGNSLMHVMKLQWALTLGLTPFTLLFFQQINSVSFISNAIAIPCVGWLILPLCLTGVLFLKIEPLSHGLFFMADHIFNLLWWFLEKMASFSFLQLHLAIPSFSSIFTTFIGMAILLSPAGFPGKYLSFLWWLPLLVNYSFLHDQEMKISILDVGKGQATLVQTSHHTLLFDTGDQWGDSDAGTQYIAPFLRIEKINRLDTLIISSDEKSLYGGAQSLLNQFPIKSIITSIPSHFANGPIHLCQAGDNWLWDNFRFTLLYPTTGSDKNPACVLLITTPTNENFIITGRLSGQGFKNLSETSLPPSFNMITPHYGSTTKSLKSFIKKIPIERLILSGKPFNKHPHFFFPVFNTEQSGMITINTSVKGSTLISYRQN